MIQYSSSWNFILNSALTEFNTFVNRSNAHYKLQQIFGSTFPVDGLLSSWLQGEFSDLPQLKIIASNNINGANGAFAQTTNTLYLSQELINSGDTTRIVKVFIEEYGHYLDAKYNTIDSQGDEGEYFAEIVTGNVLTQSEVIALQTENDHAVVTLEGQAIEIEQSAVKLTNNTINDFSPQISGNNVVWVGNDGTDNEIYFFNGITTTKLTNNNTDDSSPQISGNNIVWRGYDGTDNEIYFFNGITTTKLTNNNTDDSSPQISGNNVVWDNYNVNKIHDLYFFNGTTTTLLASSPINDSGPIDPFQPQISGNKVVWSNRFGTSDSEIFFFNGTTTRAITNNNIDDYSTKISGNNLVWNRFDGNDNEIYFFNGTTTTQLTNNNTNEYFPQISGNNVVWTGFDGTDNEIYFFNGTTTTRLTNNSANDYLPQISGNNVVWYSNNGVGSSSEIFFFNGTTTTRLTNNNTSDYFPQISGNNVVWTGFDGNDSEIYFQNPIPPILSINNLRVVEGKNNNAVINFTLNSPSNQALTVNYTTTEGTATANSDYTTTTGVLTIPANTTNATLSIPILNDNFNEVNETFNLVLSNPVGVTLNQTTAVITITDTLQTSVTATLPIEVENILLTGTDNINGNGNSGNNVLTGNSGNNILTGNGGNDTYRFNDSNILGSDTIQETIIGGIDTLNFTGTTEIITVNLGLTTTQNVVTSKLNLTFSANNVMENVIGGNGADRLTGNILNNRINGGLGNDILRGNDGNDNLIGSAGDDILAGDGGIDKFTYSSGKAYLNTDIGLDTLFDFTQGTDKLVLSKTTFTRLQSIVGNGLSQTADFAIVNDDGLADTKTAFIVYSTSSGNVFYNENGVTSGLGTGSNFANLFTLPSNLSTGDFIIIQ